MKRRGKQKTSKPSGRYGLKGSLKSYYGDSQLNPECGSPDTGSKSSHGLSKTPDDTSSESVHSRSLRNSSGGDDNLSQMESRGRRGLDKKGHNGDLDQNVFKNFADDYSNESRDREGSLPMGLSSEHELPYDDESTREPLSTKDLSGSHNSVFVEPRQPDKVTVDYNSTSHTQRKVNKRELKALLKQTKKKPSTVDETVIAAIDELAVHLKDTCVIDMKPVPRRPIPVAASLTLAARQSETPSRRGVRARRGGRRGRGARRGGLHSPTSITSAEQTVLPASWVPLILPNPLRSPMTSDPEGDNMGLKSKLCAPWLQQLPESRVHRFVVNMRRLLAATLKNPIETDHLSKKPIQLIDLTSDKQDYSTSAFDNQSKQLTSPLNSNVQNLGHPTITPSEIKNPNQLPLIKTVEDVSQNDSKFISNCTEDSASKLNFKLGENTTVTRTLVSSLIRRRGRGKKHHGFHRNFSSVKSNTVGTSESIPLTNTSLVSSSSNPINNEHVETSQHVIRMPKSTSKGKSRVSRELRGLVTWDAVMAEQRKREQELKDIEAKGGSALFHPSEVTLSVVTDFIASVEEEGLTPKLRRTRQTSGSVPSHVTHSTVGSDAASMQTTIAGHSTEVSSVSSDNIISVQKTTIHGTTVDNKPSTGNNADGSRLNHSDCDRKRTFSVTSDASEMESACVTQYSPISVEQEPNESQHVSFEQLDDGAYQSSTTVKRNISPLKSPGRRKKKYKTNRLFKSHPSDTGRHPEQYIPNDSVSQSSVTVDTRQQSDASLSVSSLPVPSAKRKRQTQHGVITSTDPLLDDPNFVEQSVRLQETEGLDTCDILPNSASSSLPSNVRRSATSRSSVLPPRKRYKVGIDTSNINENHASSDLDKDSFRDFSKSGFNESDLSVTVIDLTDNSSSTGVCHLGNADIPLSKPEHRKRGRGRPSRRLEILESNSNIPVSPCLSSSDSVSVTCDRPKREAAAMGFASLVAANLNNSGAAINSAPETPETINVRSETGSLPSPTTNIGWVEQQQQIGASETQACKPTVSRGRGRPPKQRPVQLPVAEHMLNRSAVDSENMLDSISSRPLQSVNESPLLMSSTTHPQESLQVVEATHQSSSEQSTENQQMRITEVPIDTKLKETDNNATSHSQFDSNNSLTMSIKSSKSLSIKQTNKKNSLQSSIKMKSEVDHFTIKSMANSSILSLDTSSTIINKQHCRLPSRNSFFKDAAISSSEQITFLKDRCSSGPLYELFCKFLDEPDPLEPNYRLCAPIIYLPSPERYPEFYRFTLSSHLSGSGLNVKFTSDFTNRLFSPIGNLSSNTVLNDDKIYHVEFPSLCLASIASRFILNSVKDQSLNSDDTLAHHLNIDLSEKEQNHFLIVTDTDIMEGLYSLDIAMDNMFNVWEAFTGRRSWFGRRLMKLKSVYIKHRTILVESLKLENHIPVAMPKSFIPCITKSQNNSSKKKTDRRALERGAEVIRCLCGFRVEQCDLCASWQHLPCLWWALSLAIREVDVKGEDDREVDAPYICPVCLKLDNLTKEYPRSLSAAMNLNDVDAVFDLQDTLVKGEHEFWTLGSPDGTCQIRTDDYAFVNRFWLNHLNISQDISKGTTINVSMNVKQLLDQSLQCPVKSAYDRIIVRIYRLWKDVSGLAWLEGGLFLRPYDLPPISAITDSSKCPQFWHLDEVVYDEARRVILPLDAWIGRCIVLCPSAYRVGRPADLLYTAHIKEFMPSLKNYNLNDSNPTTNQFQYFFVCEKLFEQSSVDNHTCRFDEISPGYLKVSMKPYCFLRKPDNQCIRGSLPRQYSASELLTRDQISFSESFVKDEQTFETKTSPEECTTVSGNISSSDEKNTAVPVGNLKQKGEKLARVVDWLERKRQTNSSQSTVTLPQNSIVPEQQEQQTSISLLPVENNPVVDEISSPSSRSLCSRGRIPLKINRGRSRGFNKSLKLTSSNPVSLSPNKSSSPDAILLDKIDDISSSKEDESLSIPIKRTCISENSSPIQSDIVQTSSEITVEHNSSSSSLVIIDSNHSSCNTMDKNSPKQLLNDSLLPSYTEEMSVNNPIVTEMNHFALTLDKPVIMSFNSDNDNNHLKSINDFDNSLSTSSITSNHSIDNNHVHSSSVSIDDNLINPLNNDKSIEFSFEKQVVVEDDHNTILPTSTDNISPTHNDMDIDNVNHSHCIVNNVQEENMPLITTNHEDNSLLDTSIDLHNNLTTTEEKMIDNSKYKPITKFAVETLVSDDYSTMNSICTAYNSSPEKDLSKHDEFSAELNNDDANVIDHSTDNKQISTINNHDHHHTIEFQRDESIYQDHSLLNSSSLSVKDEINQLVENETITAEIISPISLVTNSKPAFVDNDSPPISIGTPVLDEKLDSVEPISTDIIPECFQSIKTSYSVADLHTPIVQTCQLKTKFKEPSRDYGGHYENRHHSHGHHNNSSRDRDDNSPYSSRHNHGERSMSNSSHRHQDRIYTTGNNNRDPSEASNC
ncbi:hypothetical protein Smp_125110 [Schistosoma mansoni]|uniref:hypothetical protein n=1 Tax=Schistosoma mansoni TaxID=6183 RepID=UPI00022C8703|nr:hypothetical protein Smp_125110 [Schistosoma mansoni]|eukprot:XP_018646616.1 hypothetical protein Smp_125110 [Schistosoma mansoni]